MPLINNKPVDIVDVGTGNIANICSAFKKINISYNLCSKVSDFNGGKIVAIEPKCLAFPYCSQGAIDKPIKLIGENKEDMCENCYEYCSHIGGATGKKPEYIAKIIREKYLSL